MSHPEDAEQDGGKAVKLMRDQVSVLHPGSNEVSKAGEFPSLPLLVQRFLTLPSPEITAVSRVSPMSLTTPRLQSRQSALFPSHTYFCSPSGDPSPRALPVCTPSAHFTYSPPVPRCCALFLPFSPFLLPCPAQPLPLVPLSLHPCPRN